MLLTGVVVEVLGLVDDTLPVVAVEELGLVDDILVGSILEIELVIIFVRFLVGEHLSILCEH